MTKHEAEWLAASMVKEGWPEVWVEPAGSPDDWRVAFRRLPDESPRHAVRLSAAIKGRCEHDRARGVKIGPIEVLTREKAAERTRLRSAGASPVFQGTPLQDGEALWDTNPPCPKCEDEGRLTLGGKAPRLCRRENGDLVCPSHGDPYADLHEALRRNLL